MAECPESDVARRVAEERCNDGNEVCVGGGRDAAADNGRGVCLPAIVSKLVEEEGVRIVEQAVVLDHVHCGGWTVLWWVGDYE